MGTASPWPTEASLHPHRRLRRTNAYDGGVKVVVSEGAREVVTSRGGVLFVRPKHHRCCGGALTLLDSTTVPPRDASDFVAVGSEEIDVRFRGGALQRPRELVIELRGTVRRRPVAFWDGCAFKP